MKLLQREKIDKKDIFSYTARKLKKLYIPTPFSSSEYYFKPTKKDWEIVKKRVSSILLYVTNRCNSFCKICSRNSFYYDYSKEMSKNEIIQILKKIGRKKRVILIGGEPTIRKDLFEIIKIIKKSGNYPELFTNGLKLADVNYVKKLKRLNVERVYFSFDGFRKDIYRIMNGNENELTLKLLALKNLETFGIDVILSTRVVKNLNEGEIEKILNFCIASAKNNGNIKGVYLYGATRYGRFLLKDAEISPIEVFRLLNKITNGAISMNYFIETKRLALNIYKFLSKFGIYTVFGSRALITVFNAGSIKKVLPTNFLKKLNTKLETGKYLSFLFEILKNKITRKMIFNFLIKRSIIKAILLPGSFLLGFGEVSVPPNYNGMAVDTIGIEKSEKFKSPIINLSGDSGTYEA